MKTAALVLALLTLAAFCLGCRTGSGLDGAWAPNDYGTRIEIKGDKMTVLWRNREILVTAFTTVQEEGRTVLHLARNDMIEPFNRRSYGHITECWVEGEVMHLTEVMEFAGEKKQLLRPTEESRYGDVEDVTSRVLPRLRGIWRETRSDHPCEIKITSQQLFWRWDGGEWEGPVKIIVLHNNWEDDPNRFTIRHQDPAQEQVGPFIELDYKNDQLTTMIPVYDADSPKLVFKKE